MTNAEFVARKGLVSLRSSSFAETLFVSGTINSPAIAELTASWAVSASHVDLSLIGSTASLPNTLALRDNDGGTEFKHIKLDTSYVPTSTVVGELTWNLFEGTLNVQTDVSDVVIQVGQELLVKVRNNTGVTIPNGSAVFLSGSLGNRPLAYLARADLTSANRLIGLTTSDIADNSDSYVTVAGKVNGLNTSTYTEGEIVYLSDSVSGGISTVPPTGASFPIQVGTISRSHPTLGSILLNIRQEFFTTLQFMAVRALANGVVTASLYGTSSWSNRSLTASFLLGSVESASYAKTASYFTGTVISASYANTSSWSDRSITASYALTSSFSARTISASYSQTASFLLGTVQSASYAVTASYVQNIVAVTIGGNAEAISTQTFPATTTNTFLGIGFDIQGNTDASVWTFSSVRGSTFTCGVAGIYSISLSVFMQKTGGATSVGGIALMKNGVEIQGSFNSFSFGSNNTVQNMACHILENIAVGDVISARFIGQSTSVQVINAPAIGPVVTRPSAVLRITKL